MFTSSSIRSLIERARSFLYPEPTRPTTALVLSGGGARAAYQAGVLRYVAEAFPSMYFPVQTGVSAGAINTAQLSNHVGTFQDATERLEASWRMLNIEDVFQSETGLSILWGLLWRQNASEDPNSLSAADVRRTHGLLDTTPLSEFLHRRLKAPDGVLDGIAVNLADGRLQAVAMITTNYATGQTVTWVQGKDFDVWERPDRVSVHTELTVDHVMASTALPLVFPAVKIGDAWYGDGGVRLSAPLAPAVHLGADRIMVVSNQYRRSQAEADRTNVIGYPPAAQIIGIMMNAIFADTLDQDAHTLRRINRLLRDVPKRKRQGLRPVRLLQIRPSVDLGQLAYDYHDHLPASVRFLTSGLGSGDTRSPDWLSVLLFLPEYVDRLMDIGYHDARDRHRDLSTFFEEAYDEREGPASPGSSAPGSPGMSGDGSLGDHERSRPPSAARPAVGGESGASGDGRP